MGPNAQGAECALDGRGAVVPGHEAGNFLGPTILANVTMDMDVWTEEIFAPVLVCLEVRAWVGTGIGLGLKLILTLS